MKLVMPSYRLGEMSGGFGETSYDRLLGYPSFPEPVKPIKPVKHIKPVKPIKPIEPHKTSKGYIIIRLIIIIYGNFPKINTT